MSLEADSGNATRSELVYQANSCSETITPAQSWWNLIAPLFFSEPYPDMPISGCNAALILASRINPYAPKDVA
jgi:hypothetical protein